MSRKNFLLFFLLPFLFNLKGQVLDSLTFSEVMFRPSAENSEFIELFNLSFSDSIDLTGWGIKYSSAKTNYFDSLTVKDKLPPRSFAVVLEADYDSINGIYKDLIPQGCLVLRIEKNAFGSSGMSNSSDRPLCLISPEGDTTEVYTYSADNKEGYSDEKINLVKSNDGNNWRNAISFNGTPGKKNSISPKDYDLALTEFEIEPNEIFLGDSVTLKAKIKNEGLKRASGFNFEISLSTDSLIYSTIFQKENLSLDVKDSLIISTKYSADSVFEPIFKAKIIFGNDENSANDSLVRKCVIRPEPNSKLDVVINEIMYSPKEDEPEWIELYNTTGKKINLKNWFVSDKTSRSVLSNEILFIEEGGFVVFARDSLSKMFKGKFNAVIINLPSLNNGGDEIILSDSLGQVIDSVNYSSSWGGGKGVSLERKEPAGFSNKEENWGSSLGFWGGTPVRLNSVSSKDYDLAVTDFSTDEKFNEYLTPLDVSVTVKNLGKKESEKTFLFFYLDANNDYDFKSDLLLDSVEIPILLPRDSISFFASLGNLPVGLNRILSVVKFDSDEFEDNNVSSLLINTVRIEAERNDVAVNEIMYFPSNDEPEWIELFNKSGKELNLQRFTLSDKSHTVTITSDTLKFPPSEYLVIAKDSSFFNFWNAGCKVLILNFSSLNNSGDAVILRDSLGRVIDSLYYLSNWGGGKGKSLERISAQSPSTDSLNWGTSIAKGGATPGKINSVSLKNFDLSLQKLFASQDYFVDSSNIELNFVVKNLGVKEATSFDLKIFFDRNNNGQAETSEMLKVVTLTNLTSGDSLTGTIPIDGLPFGEDKIIGVVDFNEDEFNDNDSIQTAIKLIKINEQKGDIVINEIMYTPRNDEPEWVEIFNRSDKEINLKNYFLSDNRTTVKVNEKDLVIKPFQYSVISRDSSILNFYSINSSLIVADFPSLNNDGDMVVLKDSLLRTIDSVKYSANWGGNDGCSLERISVNEDSNDSTNWCTSKSPEHGTPGKYNSVSQKDYDLSVDSVWTTPLLPKAGNNLTVTARIKNKGKKEATFNLEIFEVKNDSTILKQLTASSPLLLASGASTTVSFNNIKKIEGTIDLLVKIVFPQDQDSTNNAYHLTVVPEFRNSSIVINEIMLEPSNSEPEWFELVNNSDDTLNVKNWGFTDVIGNGSVTILTDDDLFIPPRNYLVVAKDSSIFDFHKTIPSFVIVKTFANLNNSEDGIVLKDGNSETIDSVFYKGEWLKKEGYSLERKNVDSLSTSVENWGTSQDEEHSSPGRINSISPKQRDVIVTDIFSEPYFPVKNSGFNAKIKLLNLGTKMCENVTVKIYSFQNNKWNFIESMNVGKIEPRDSVIISTKNKIGIVDSLKIKAEAECRNDENIFNNSLEKTIFAGVNTKAILVSEFFIFADSVKQQWIEFYNATEDSIDIKNWTVSDFSPYPKSCEITNEPVFIKPREYFVVFRGSKIHGNRKFKSFASDFGQLNVNGDGIILKDFRGQTIDSLKYDKGFKFVKGRSLERMNFNDSTNNENNWHFSLSPDSNSIGMENSTLSIIPANEKSVVINEIMFEVGGNHSEYVEIFNTTDNPIDIGGWEMNIGGNKNFVLSYDFKKLKGKNYFVLAADSSLLKDFNLSQKSYNNIEISNTSGLNLSNEEDYVVIRDALGNKVDSVHYKKNWGNSNMLTTKNKSLEKLNPLFEGNSAENWSTCVNSLGGTPLSKNSVFTPLTKIASGMKISPNPFSPDEDGYEDFTLITFKLKFPTAQINVKIFDDHGRLVRNLVANKSVANKGEIVFDGKDDNGRILRMGMYIVFLQAVDSRSKQTETLKDVVVIAHKLN